MNIIRPIRLLFGILIISASSFAQAPPQQVPQLINYQGRVVVNGTNFDGPGQFKFALVNGVVGTGISTYWSNDGTSTGGSQPMAAVSLAVAKGLYSVLLGDSTVANMTIIPATVFTNADVRLRVWFNDGSHGFQLLTPDQRITAVGYAIMAGNVTDGSITSAKIAAGAVGASQLSPNAVQGANIATGAVGAAQLANGAISTSLGYTPADSSAVDPVNGNVLKAATYCSAKMATWTGTTAAPLRILVQGDSLATNTYPGPYMSVRGRIGLCPSNVTGSVQHAGVDVAADFTLWLNGQRWIHAVGSTAELSYGGQTGASGDIQGDKCCVAYIKKPGGGSFVLQYQANGSGTWITLDTLSCANPTTVGAYVEYSLPSSNSPFYRLRVTNVTTAPVDIILSGIYNTNGGGVIWMENFTNAAGHDIYQCLATPTEIFNPIWTRLAPDMVLSEWADGAEAWIDAPYTDLGGTARSTGAYRIFYAQAKAAFSATDYVMISNHSMYAPSLDPDPAVALAKSEASCLAQVVAQRKWAQANGETFVDNYHLYGGFTQATARGLMGDNTHFNLVGAHVRWLNMWSVIPLGQTPLGAVSVGSGAPLDMPAFTSTSYGSLQNLEYKFNRSLRMMTGTLSFQKGGFEDPAQAWSFNSVANVPTFRIYEEGSPLFEYDISGNLGFHPCINNQGQLGRSGRVWLGVWATNGNFTNLNLSKTITPAGTTTQQTINQTSGSVNFAPGETSQVVANSLVGTSSVIIATVATNDSTLKSVQVVASAGSFTIYANAPATTESRINFIVTN